MAQNEDTRVKIPALVTLTRLGYTYLSLKDHNHAKGNIDRQTNIFTDIFFKSLERINPAADKEELAQILNKITNELDYDDLGKAFYKRLIDQTNIKLIDFTYFSKNSFHVVTELEYINGEDNFRPDITVLINGMPLIFIEVKKPNNKEGILAERKRINTRFQNSKFRRFINITQLLIFSNNMPYEENATTPLQGAFYCSSSKNKAFFNLLKEEERIKLEANVSEISPKIEEFILRDTNYPTLKSSSEYETNKNLKTPTNSILLSLLSKDRIKDILRYAFAYVEFEDDEGKYHLEKHIMRYPQFFASKAIQQKLSEGQRKGVIWHTQGSGKTALSYYNVRWLTDYFQKQNIITKFYFIVDRIDLKNQAMNEFAIRGLRVKTIDSKTEFVNDIKQHAAIDNNNGELEITVVNIHKFSEDSKVAAQSDYNLQTQRIYFIDEAHRSYDPKGSFLANLINSDPNAILISLTGTPLLAKGKRQSTTSSFGGYFHKYYYNQSIADGYTVKLIREDIETVYKMKLKDALAELKIQKGSVEEKKIYCHPHFITPMLEYITEDLRKTRIRFDDSIGAMVVCQSSDQARALYALFEKDYAGKAKDSHMPNKASLILCDVEDKEFRKNEIRDFKKGSIDILFVYNMLLTGFDAPRLKKLYLNRQVNDHNLLQTLTRVNRPYKDMKQGFVVDFVNILDNFNKTNDAYWKELTKELGDEIGSYSNMFMDEKEISRSLEEIKDILWRYDTENTEIFSSQISAITDKKLLYQIRNALQNAKELYNLIRLYGYDDLLDKLDFTKFKQLLAYTEDKLYHLNLQERLTDTENRESLINEAMEDIIFSFEKRGEAELKLADEFHNAMKRTREAILNNLDHNDPEWITLKEQLETFFHKRDYREMNHQDIQQGIQELNTIYAQILQLNRQNSEICHKYKNDPKYLRIHKHIVREKMLSVKERMLCDILNNIKDKIDSRLLEQDIMSNETIFSRLVMRNIMTDFKAYDINMNFALQEQIKNLLVKEYYKELKDYDRQ